jgi:hypothetical protein
MAVHNQTQTMRAIKGGVVAGLVAGVALSVLLAVMNAIQGHDVLRGLKFAGVPLLGPRALEPGFDHVAIVVGQVCHLAVSLFWGVTFALLFFGLSKGMTLLAGAFWGFVSFIIMLYVVMPMIGFPAGGGGSVVVAIVEHVIFGVMLGAAFLPYQREIPSIPRRRPTPQH